MKPLVNSGGESFDGGTKNTVIPDLIRYLLLLPETIETSSGLLFLGNVI
ncbi:hypothetical protein [Candidatus Megaera venefica]|nr:hypothetical protein [Candidatus Megaera venefica]